ncbi:PA14 domain-containing protein [Streptomyces sp. NPDC091287]|uniref:PA14 domain-containing protein n=1 Tax=Streptomyces sp. NPDC091287 TaxID=3365988 RepID=UPI00380DD403
MAVTFTLIGAEAPAVGGKNARAAADVPPLAPKAGSANRPSWPVGVFDAAPGRAAGGPSGARTTGPENGAVVPDPRPVLTAERQKGAVAYEFVVSTGDTPGTGQVTSSGWLRSPRWRVPAGELKDGGQYRWTVRAKNRSGAAGPDAPARSLTVNQRLGAQAPGGPVPTDTLGPVSVNLATGNVSASFNTAQLLTGAGVLGATFGYDSQRVAASAGLSGSYYAGDSESGIGAGEKPAAQRTDTRVDFNWGGEAPYPDADREKAFRARWTGLLTVPATGRYRLGGSYDGGLRILVDGKPVLDDWKRGAATGDRPVYGKELRLTAGRSHRVTVEYRGRPADGRAALWVSGTGRSSPVPASWLQPAGAVLPPGWSVTPDATGAGADAAANRAAGTGLSGQAGAGASRAGASGAPQAASGAPQAASGAPQAASGAPQAASGAAPKSPAAPGAEKKGAEAAPATAAAIAAAEEEGLKFFYAGSPECTDDAAPAGYVCAVRVPAVGTTQLVYREGKLTRFVNPGDEVTDFGFAADHRLTAVRTPLIVDWIAADRDHRDTAAAQYRIGYQDGSAAAAWVEGPEPSGNPARSELRPRNGYGYGTGSATVTAAGVPTPQGWTRRVTLDERGRVLTDTDGTRRTVRTEWTEADEPASFTDPAGRVKTTVYGDAGQVEGVFGPGPRSCFGTDRRLIEPAPDGCAKVPAETTSYAPTGSTTVRADSDGVPAQATQTALNELGLPVATIVDPQGLALRSGLEFDEAFRPAATSRPTGAKRTFAYYGPDETADNPCTDESDPAPQRGLPKSIDAAAPASGPARQDRFVFNAKGQIVAQNAGQEGWTCLFYDGRGRPVSMVLSGNANGPEREVRYDHAAQGDPLTLHGTEQGDEFTKKVDLLGRTVSLADGRGTLTRTVYDQGGRPAEQRVTLPGGDRTTQTARTVHDAAGRPLVLTLDGAVLARVTLDAAGQTDTVRYGNRTRLAVERDPAGRITAKRWTLADGRTRASEVVRSRSGKVVDETTDGVDARPDGPNYRYDAAGRLIQAWVPGHAYTYDFTSAADSSCPAGTRRDAGANGNRMRLLDRTTAGTKTTTYCYDNADRLLATTGDRPLTGFQYTANGNLKGYQDRGAATTQRYDYAERYLGGRVGGPAGTDVSYTHGIADSFIKREVKGAGAEETLLFGHTSIEDQTIDLTYRTDKQLLARTVALPGGVVHTRHGDVGTTPDSWSYPTVRGDVFLVAGSRGRQAGDTYRYTPFGEPLRADGTVDPGHVPDNQPGSFDHAWRGQYQSGYEHAGVLSNAVLKNRVLNLDSGRFSVPVEEPGFLNSYEYVAGDPINNSSSDGFELDEKE